MCDAAAGWARADAVLRTSTQGQTVSQPEIRLGELLIQRRLISASDLQEALDAQTAAPSYIPLGQLLIDRGLVDFDAPVA